jgi:hypothetical protein
LLTSDAEIAVGGCVSARLAVVVAPLPSVTVTVYDVALKPVAVALVCAGDVLQTYE